MIKEFKPFGENLRKAIAAAWTQSHNEWVRKKHILQQQQHLTNTSDIMYNMTVDLFEAIGNRNYPNLQNISYLADIRLHNFRIVNGCTVYQFEIDKVSENRISIPLRKKLRDNMNHDIVQAQRQIISIYGAEWLAAVYPFLYSGMYITSVQDIGHSVIIDVVSHIQP